jgi:hypothetical protein
MLTAGTRDRTPTHGYEPRREAAMAGSRRAGGGSSSKIGKSAFGGKPENLRFGTSEARSIGRVTAALVPCSFGIGADWTPPERLIAVWRCPGCDQFSWGLALLDPLFERSQWIDTGMRRARSFVLDAAMVHAGHHEQTRKVLNRSYSADFLPSAS